jgi:hypothetical protein
MQRVSNANSTMEQDVTLWVKVMANEYTIPSPSADDPGAYGGGPKLSSLVNEVGAMLDALLLNGFVTRTIPVGVVAGPRSKPRGEGEAFLEYVLTLTYARLAAEQLGLDRCTTEVVLEGLRALVDGALVDRYGPQRRAYRDIENPTALQAEHTPAIIIEDSD